MFGETPNLADRLQALAASNQVIVDSATKRLVGDEFEFADQRTVSLKGFAMPTQVWQVLGSKPSASRFESYRSRRLTNFIGREHETALLLGRWREAVEGEGRSSFSAARRASASLDWSDIYVIGLPRTVTRRSNFSAPRTIPIQHSIR